MILLTLTKRVTFQYICPALQGDSGGLLVYLENDGRNTQVDIVSFGAAAGCTMGYPVVSPGSPATSAGFHQTLAL